MIASIIDKDYIQYGFAGFAIILLGILVWLIKERNSSDKESQKQLITVIEKNNSVLAKLIDVLRAIEIREEQTAGEVVKFRESGFQGLSDYFKGETWRGAVIHWDADIDFKGVHDSMTLK